jgi:hypothetical protein
MAVVKGIPGYWMNETSGALRPAVDAYLGGRPMTAVQIAAMRIYLRLWINADWQGGATLDRLRRSVDELTTVNAIRRWLHDAGELEIDPL